MTDQRFSTLFCRYLNQSGDASFRVAKVFRQLVQTHAKVSKILMGNILKNNEAIFDD